jgi:hypothetical protein
LKINYERETHEVLTEMLSLICDLTVMDESEVIRTRKKIELMPNKKRRIKKSLVVKR